MKNAIKTEALEVMKNRRAIRKFKPEQITANELDAVLEAGTYAPTGGGRQGFVIVAAQDPAIVAELNRMNAKAMDADADSVHPYYGAPTILLVLATGEAVTPVEDCSAIACNLLNAAYAVGLGSCWVHRCKEMFEGPEGKALLQKWGLPENAKGVASVALGYADCPHPEAAPRKDGLTLKV
jgi:nitroreductase